MWRLKKSLNKKGYYARADYNILLQEILYLSIHWHCCFHHFWWCIVSKYFSCNIFTLFFLISIIIEWKKLIYHVFSNEPQIILNKEGLETYLTPFTRWENVSDIKVFRHSSLFRRVYTDLFTFTRKNKLNYEYEKMEITEFNTNVEDLSNLIKYYKNIHIQSS